MGMLCHKDGTEATDLISVIIPVYNTERFLTECLESITAQTYPHLEILLIDNVSTDSSLSIARRFAKKDSRIRVIEKKEHGVCGSSRNIGIREAKGRYISFLDSDDIIKPHALETMLRAMLTHDVDIVQCCYEELYENRKTAYKINYQDFHIYSGRELCKMMAEFIGLCGPNVMLWNKLYKREVWEGVSFYEGYVYEDMFTTYKILYPASRVAFLPDRLYYWRKDLTSNASRYNYSFQNYHEIIAYKERANFYRRMRDRELYALTLKRCYYIATQHLYMQSRFIPRAESRKVIFWLEDTIKTLYPELMRMKCFGRKTKRRMRLIRYFPWLFGAVSMHHPLDFRI